MHQASPFAQPIQTGFQPASRLFTFSFFLLPSYAYRVTRPFLSPYSNLRNESIQIQAGAQPQKDPASPAGSLDLFGMFFIIINLYPLRSSLRPFLIPFTRPGSIGFSSSRIKSLPPTGRRRHFHPLLPSGSFLHHHWERVPAQAFARPGCTLHFRCAPIQLQKTGIDIPQGRSMIMACSAESGS
jgi:hypothetical protein